MSRTTLKTPTLRIAAAVLAAALGAVGYHCIRQVFAEEESGWNRGLPQQHKSIWKVHDDRRPKPPPVAPGAECREPPADAIVLFDGEDLSRWNGKWKVENGYMEANSTGSITTKDSFGDCQLHIEYMAPSPPQKGDQARGNSGIILMTHYEVQVLDNYDNPTYSDGYIGAVYGQHPPLVLACRKPGEWQTYDIVFRAPRFKGETGDEVEEPGRVTVFLNGVLVQHNAEIYGWVAYRSLAKNRRHPDRLPLLLQDHGDRQPVRFRNIWIRELDLSWEAIDNRK
ncbi:MAG: DUF1080 domain-containing protein [Planctomycetes bacterium]|nr:DUF1080 domain-containing protein [Planctomycetota bacterium]